MFLKCHKLKKILILMSNMHFNLKIFLFHLHLNLIQSDLFHGVSLVCAYPSLNSRIT